MRRLLPIALILLSPVAFAQTTLDITVPGDQVCSYATGPVSNGSVPGHLQATATSSSGAGCGSGSSGNVTFGPATPVAATPVTVYNGTSTISFQALNANTKCVGSISPSAGSSFVGGSQLCTGSQCQSPVTATAQVDNESDSDVPYTVSVTCTGTAGQATSQTSFNVPGKLTPPAGCFAFNKTGGGQYTRMDGNITVKLPDNSTSSRDAKSFNAIFGSSSNPLWPGHLGVVFLPVPTSQYLSLQFKVPDNFYGTPPNVGDIHGNYTVNASGVTANMSMSISTKCGDFSAPGGASTTICRKTNMRSGALITWWSAPGTSCSIQNGGTYYLNIINADVSSVTANGGGTAAPYTSKNCGATCQDPVINGSGSWFYPVQ